MHNSAHGRYSLRFPEALHEIDPDFAEHWLLPFFTEDGVPVLPGDTDYSPLEAYSCADLPVLEQRLPDLFRGTDLEATLSSVPPLTAAELADLLPRISRKDPDAVSRIVEAYLQTMLSVLSDYRAGTHRILEVLPQVCQYLEAALDDRIGCLPGCFHGYVLWQIRYAAIRELWAHHPENPRPGSRHLLPEYRLRDPDGPIFAKPGEKIPAVALSATPLARIYRFLQLEHPDIFRDILDSLIPREREILELVMTENCLLTIHDAADRFSVSELRIRLTLRKFLRLTRSPGVRRILQSAGF